LLTKIWSASEWKHEEIDAEMSGKRHKQCPAGLNDEAKLLWGHVTEGWQLDEPGFALLRNACMALTRLRHVQKTLREDGLTVKDRFGQLRAHPLLSAERDAASSFRHDIKSLNLNVELPSLERT
jgi:phage terminase small subunit